MKKGISTIMAVGLSVVVMAALAAGGWYLLDKKWKSDRKTQDDQIATLLKEVEGLKKNVSGNSSVDSRGDKTNISISNNKATYTSAKHGYSFQYPTGYFLWDYSWDNQTNQKVDTGKVVLVNRDNYGEHAIPASSEYPIPNHGIAVWVDENTSTGLSAIRGDGAGIQISDVIVDGQKAWKAMQTVTSDLDNSYSTTIFINHNNNVYGIVWANSDAQGTHDPAIDDILSSFKFN